MSMSMRWLGPGPTLAVTVTRACGWAAFHIHFSAGILAGGRANLMAVERGRRRKKKKRAVGNMGRREDGMVVGRVYCHPWRATPLDSSLDSVQTLEYRAVSGTMAHSRVRIGAKDTRCLREQKKRETC